MQEPSFLSSKGLESSRFFLYLYGQYTCEMKPIKNMLWNALLMVLKIVLVIAITLTVGTITQAAMNAIYYSMTGSPMPYIPQT